MKCKCTLTRTALSAFAFAAMALTSLSAQAEYVKLTALSGSRALEDGEGCAKLVDADYSTKWCQSTDFDNGDERWIIVKADKAFTPENYFLITGNDTNADQARNWKNWNIYGANFENDADATREANGWKLIDAREDAIVSVKNFGVTSFKLNDEETLTQYDGTPYQYYMIEVTAMKEAGSHYLQMSEFGFGTYAEFQTWIEEHTPVINRPIGYTVIAGDRNNGDSESVDKLFDDNPQTKWGNGITAKKFGETTNGAYFIVQTSRSVLPTYYKLVTANDNASYKGRNWCNWQIYGINLPKGEVPTRTSEGWVMIDRKINVTADQLPDKNFYEVLFTLSEQNATAYDFFKVEIDDLQGATFMQMSEFSLGDESTFESDRNKALESAAASVDVNGFGQKSLVDEYTDYLTKLETTTDPVFMVEAVNKMRELETQINLSYSSYATLNTAFTKAETAVKEETVTAEAIEYLTKYLGEEAIAPCDEYPVGNAAYIKANRQISAAEANAEAVRLNGYVNENTSIEVDPIYAEYDYLGGNEENCWGDGHPSNLIDGDRDGTKWGGNMPGEGWIIFKSNTPIKPTYYGLVTGGDTQSYPSRNWKTWNIYAANFDSDDEATKESDKWVLIDEKKNIGTDILKTTNRFESYIDLSNPPSQEYQYFKIVVFHDGGMQMNEFTFYNQGNFNEKRQGFIDEVNQYMEDKGFMIDENTYASQNLLDEFFSKMKQLAKAPDAPTLMVLKNRLIELVDEIITSAAKYQEYMVAADDINPATFGDYAQAAAWAEGYISENVGPCAKYIHGTKEYILSHRNISNDEINDEILYLKSMIAAAEDAENAGYIVLGGNTVDEYSDGHYTQLVDNIVRQPVLDSEGKQTVNAAGELMFATKWGGSVSEEGNTYVIFRTIEAVNPYFYTLTTGGDTFSYQGRNWKTWEIYGANFEGDGEATKDAEGWVLVDRKENIGQNRLHPESMTASYFGFSTETQEKYMYYKVVVYACYSGNRFQMQELRFGTEEEFETIKEQYIDEAKEFDYSIMALNTLSDKYEQYMNDIDEAYNMEQLFRIHDGLDSLKNQITASNKQYLAFEKAVEANKEYLQNNIIAQSEALTIFQNYLNETVEPSEELYPNGSATYVLDECELTDSALVAEMTFMDELKAAAIAAGYGKGADISSLIINRTMAEKAADHDGGGIELTGWDGVAYRTATNINDEGESMSSAEFCNAATHYDMSQTLSGLTNGYYKVTLNAAFRPNGDINSFNYNAYAYANDIKSYIPVVREYMTEGEEGAWLGTTADKPIYACNINEPTDDPEVDSLIVGYVVWGCEGSNNAFQAGRYAMTMVAKVTDGTLKIGLANDGTTNGGDWTCAGNFGLIYLGEEEADAAEALAEAAACNDARTAVLAEYQAIDATEMKNEYKKAPNFGAAQLAVLNENMGKATFEAAETISATIVAINETKKAYNDLVGVKDIINAKWVTVANNMDAEDKLYEAVDNINAGLYDNAEAAQKAAADLLAQYPDLLAAEADNSNVVVDMADNSFAYNVEAIGRNPMVVIGGAEGKGLYQAIKADEVKEVTLTFDYTSDTELNSIFYIGKASDETQSESVTLAAVSTPTTVTIDVTKAVKDADWNFLQTADDLVRWQLAKGECSAALTISNIRINTVAKPATEPGDVNGDGAITIKDVVAVLEIMAADGADATADVNGDGAVTIKDVVAVLEIMAAQ